MQASARNVTRMHVRWRRLELEARRKRRTNGQRTSQHSGCESRHVTELEHENVAALGRCVCELETLERSLGHGSTVA